MRDKAETPRFQVSVGELAGLSGLLRVYEPSLADELIGAGRLQLGVRLHQAYVLEAKSRHPDYRSERSVRQEFAVKEHRVTVTGRMDGLYQQTDGMFVVEELKTWMSQGPQMDLYALPPQVLEGYKRQCLFYCHLLSLEPEFEGAVRGELVLMDAVDGSVSRMELPYDRAECQSLLEARLDEVMGARIEFLRRDEQRRAHGRALPFPFDRFRRYQKEMTENLGGAAASGLALMVSAPTGIGKTAAALHPMLASCLSNGRRLMYVTAKVSQQELALDTLERLTPPSSGVSAVQLEAKERSCPLEEMLCLPRHCALLRDIGVRMHTSGLPDRLMAKGVVRAPDFRAEAAGAGLCPFELSLAAAYRADAVVADLNYVFHPQTHLKRMTTFDPGSPRPRPWSLVADEAHNLYWRALDFLSPALDRREIRTLAEGCFSGPNPIYRDLLEHLLSIERLFDAHVQEIDEGPSAGVAEAVVELNRVSWADIQVHLEMWLLDYLAYVKSGGRRPLPFVPRKAEGSRRIIDPAINFCLNFFAFCQAVEQPGEHMAPVLYREGTAHEQTLRIHCLDPSRYLAERFKRFHSAVAMSATMEPMSFYSQVLGLTYLSHAACTFPSPFPAEHRLVVADTSVSTRYEERTAHLPAVARKAVTLASLRPGNHLVFFPSYAYQSSAAALMRAHALKEGLNVDVSEVSDPGQGPAVLEQLRTRAEQMDSGNFPRRSLAVCTVMGGVLSEGVDYPGHMASSAIVVGPALPAPTFERLLMRKYHDKHDGQGFDYAFVYPGLNRVVQAAGRVIRSETDRGVIVLMGERFADRRYRDLLPAYWQEELILTDDCIRPVRDFWDGQPPST